MAVTQAIGATEATQQQVLADLDALILLRRVVRLLESQGVVDSANRQRVIVDAAITIASGTITTVSTVAAQTTLAGMDREMYINQARVAYNTGIRAKLT